MPPSRRDELIDAAMRVFYRNGFHCTNLDKVLSEGGISRMTLYNHFKSKDELILAALRRRDEQFRVRMIEFAHSQAQDPLGRVLAVFDFHQNWFKSKAFCGCMFIKASAEYCDPASPVRTTAAEHKRAIVRFIREQCELAGLGAPALLAEQINILLDGAIVAAQVVGQVKGNEATPALAAQWARQAAEQLIQNAQQQV